MVAKPGGEFCFIQIAAGEGQHQAYNLFLRCIDSQAVQAEKEVHGLECDTLVPVDEGVVSGNPKPIGGGQTAEVRSGFILETVSWPAEGGVQKTLVSEPEGASMRFDLVSVHGKNKRH